MAALSMIIAEDDPAMQNWLHTVLARMGASVRLASSGWELLSLLSDDAFAVDLVISDVRMPLPGGFDALAMARTAGVTVPFVLITAFADDRLRDAARGLDASVLDKPFLALELETRIRELLEPRPVASPA
jgi:DNA-binding response OmpR family regulator